MGKGFRGLVLWSVTLAIGGCAYGTDYYVGRAGDDANPGTSAEQAWKTLKPVNESVFKPGDRILFEAGSRHVGQLKPQGSGAEGKPIVIDRYGDGPAPRIDGEGTVEAALYLFNIEYWEVQNLELSNRDNEPSAEKGRRAGVFIHLNNFGTAHHIHLKKLHVCDVSGWGGHGCNSGDGITWESEGKEKPSNYDGLLIEGCRIERTHLNGIWGFSQHWIKKPWVPNLNVVIRNNLLEDLGLSGIVPVGCDGALVEHNRVSRASRGGGGIGIWPWSCDNTVIQYNEVSGSDGTHDGQAFDSDWNCRNTVFQYNYSHDNPGGFMLVCTTRLHEYNIGCIGTVIRYNISVNDGGTATHVFHIAGPCENTYIYNNTFYTGRHLDVNLIEHMNWEGYADKTYFFNNAVYADGRLTFRWLHSTNNFFASNAWFGNIEGRPEEQGSVTDDPLFFQPGRGGDIDNTRLLASLDAYRLQENSPLIDKGTDLKALLGIDMGSRDYYGSRVPAGAGYDIGACELAPAEGRPIRILPLGDSITQQDGLGYRYYLWKGLLDAEMEFDLVGSKAIPAGKTPADWPEHGGRAFDADHEGHAGWTSADLVDGCSWESDAGKLPIWLRMYTPDIVLLHIGTNDAFQGLTTERSVIKIGEIIDLLQAANPEVKIYLAKIIPLCGEWAADFNRAVLALNERIDGIAAAKSTETSKVVVVDHFSGFTDDDTDDDIHPNESGERKMASRWAGAILYDGTPVAVEDRFRTVQGKRIEVDAAAGVLANDYSEGVDMEAMLVDVPAHGKATLRTDGGLRYVPKKGFVGTDRFTYRAQAGGKASRPCAVQIEVGSDSPVANADRHALAQDTTLQMDAARGVLSNDVCHRKRLQAMLTSPPAHGKLALNADGSFAYTPEAGFVGADTFAYTADDGAKVSEAVAVDLWVGHAGPVAWWKLDEREGTVAADSVGNLAGTLTNMEASCRAPDGNEGALRFDGADDHVTLPALNLDSNTVTFTAWVKREGAQPIFSGIVFSADGDTLAGLGFGSGPGWSANHELGYFWNRQYWNWHSELIVPDGEWCLVALVVTPTRGTVYLGQNGVVTSSSNVGTHLPERFGGVTRIGNNAEKERRFFKGLIRDVRVYDRPLSEDEIKQLAVAFAG